LLAESSVNERAPRAAPSRGGAAAQESEPSPAVCVTVRWPLSALRVAGFPEPTTNASRPARHFV